MQRVAPEHTDRGGWHRGALSLAAIALLAVTLGACDGTSAPSDGGPPPAVSLPELAPCTSGLREVGGIDDASPVVCEPWPEAGRPTCTGATLAVPGEATCASVGSPCPSSEWPSDLGVPVIYVRPGAAAGDGTEGAPFATIAEALAASADGSTIALARGTYAESVSIDRAVTLRGACASEVRIAPAATTDAAVIAGAAGVVIRDVTISSPANGVEVAPGSSLDAIGLAIDGAVGCGVFASGDARLTLTSAVIRDVGRGTGICDGAGVLAVGMSEIAVTRAAIERAASAAISLGSPSGPTASRGTLAQVSTATSTMGLFCAGCAVDGSDVVIEDATSVGVLVYTGSLSLHGFVVRDVTPSGGILELGRGISTQSATLDLERGLVERVHDVGITLSAAGSTLAMRDVVVRDVASRPADRSRGRGLVLDTGATGVVSRVWLERTREVSVSIFDEGSRLEATDLTVRDTLPNECDVDTCVGQGGGSAVGAYNAATVRLERFALVRSKLCGVQVWRSASVDLVHGEIAENGIGACLGEAGYDIARLMQDVVYRDNGTTIDSREVYVPEPLVPSL